MAVDLNREVCAQCGVRLTYRESVVEDGGTLYCCPNCFAHAHQPALAPLPKQEFCACCGNSLLETQTRVQRGVNVYCCNNCADARERERLGRPA